MTQIVDKIAISHFINQLETLSMNQDEIWQKYEELSSEQKLEIIKEILGKEPAITIVLYGNCNGNTNSIQNSIVFQSSDSTQETSEEILKKIKDIPGEAIEKLIIAIADEIEARAYKKNLASQKARSKHETK